MNFLKVGVYQLRNLLAQKVKFLYFDLRAPGAASHALLIGSRNIEAENVLSAVESEQIAKDHPIVLICETGEKSVAAAHVLAENSFINVFVIEGGVNSFEQA